MTWGPYVNCEPVRSAEEQVKLEEERRARKRLRRLGWIMALALSAIGLRNCAAIGDRVGNATTTTALHAGAIDPGASDTG